MKIGYLVDTDWIIHYLSGTEEIIQKLEEFRPHGLAVSIIALAELYEGVYYSKNPEASQRGVDDFLFDMPVLGLKKEVCQIFGRERGKLRRQGNIIGDFDLLIAATCLHYNLTLLTNNVRHFERVEGLSVTSVQNK
jgi:predicted nucleic acid-binding protein